MWDFEFKRGEELRDICDFGVDYIFEIDQEEEARRLVEKYQREQERLKKIGLAGNLEDAGKFLDKLEDLAVYSCNWV